MGERELREEICDIGRRLHERGFVAAWDGNVSHRLPDGTFLCTPTLCSKGRLRPDELCVVDAAGRQLSGPRARTSEILLHLVIYRERPDVNAVVHAHPPHATAFAVSGTPIPSGVLAEVEYFLGVVPTVPYETPGTARFCGVGRRIFWASRIRWSWPIMGQSGLCARRWSGRGGTRKSLRPIVAFCFWLGRWVSR